MEAVNEQKAIFEPKTVYFRLKSRHQLRKVFFKAYDFYMELKQIEQLPATDQAHTLQKILGIFKNKKIYFSQMRNCIVKIGKYIPILTKKYFSKNIYFFNFQAFFLRVSS